MRYFYFSSKVKHKDNSHSKKFFSHTWTAKWHWLLYGKMVEGIDQIGSKQLLDCALAVFNKALKFSICEMLSTKLKFASDCLKGLFSKKYQRRF